MPLNRREFVKQSAAIGLTLGGSFYVSQGSPVSPAGAAGTLRPPGAIPEDDFLATCIRCSRCVDACPNHALVPLPIGVDSVGAATPSIQPRKAACMLCSNEEGDYLKCTSACPTGALRKVEKNLQDILENVSIGVAEIDLNLCYSYNNWTCGACFRACPLAGQAMTVGMWERPKVNTEKCVGCGCCERSCIRYPHAIRVKANRA